MRFNLSKISFVLFILCVAGASGFAHDADDRLEKLDKNKDGKVSTTEYEAGATEKFTMADTNRDSILKKEELKNFMKDEHGKPAAKAEKKSKIIVSMFDENGDQEVTALEMKTGANRMFTEMDTNQDSYVDAPEMKNAHEIMHRKK